MKIRLADLDDAAEMAALTDLLESARVVDSPFVHPRTPQMVTAEARYGYDLEPDVVYVGYADGELVAHATLSMSEWDNRDLAWLGVTVHPERRGRGHGAAMLRHLEGKAGDAGRSLLGLDAWDESLGAGFVDHHGYDRKSAAILRRQVLGEISPDTVQRLSDEASVHAGDYELLRLAGPLPQDLLDDFCRMAVSINDAPLDDLELEDDVYEPKRLRDREQAFSRRGLDVYRVVARHRPTGELAGHSTVLVERWAPGDGYQEDTTVTPSHRGHRLGLALKADMLGWLAEGEPRLATLDTWNTETNDHMIAINERLGYRIVARALQFQKRP